jgi:hypothetical protein
VAPTRSNQSARHCTRTVTAGTLTIAGHAGVNRVRFAGRLSARRVLGLGRYLLTVRATDPGGLRSGPGSVAFRIVRR